MELDLTNQSLNVYKALASETRLEILRFIGGNQKSISDIASHLAMSNAIVTRHIQDMEDAGLVASVRGTGSNRGKKMVSLKVDSIKINFPDKIYHPYALHEIDLKVGHFTDYYVEPTCGLATKQKVIGKADEPRFFMDSERMDASLLWFTKGYVEYKIPNLLQEGQVAELLEVSFEISSEFPISNNVWPSDISIFINGVRVAIYTVGGNYSDTRGTYTPSWWGDEFSQYGELKHVRVNKWDTGIDGVSYSDVTIADLHLDASSLITLRFEVEKNAKNKGGLTIFGEFFGNHKQNIRLNTYYTEKKE